MLYHSIVSLTGPINCSVAREVLKKNGTKIVMSGVNAKLLAIALNSYDALSQPLYRRAIDPYTGASTDDRLIELLGYVTDAVKVNGEVFKQLLLSLAECGEQDLSDLLCQHYCKLIQ